MPSPFPGMDPYLEAPGFFPGLHHRLITSISDWLQERLPEPYFAELGERVWVDYSERFREPDVDVLRKRTRRKQRSDSSTVATRTAPIVIRVASDERKEMFVEIYAKRKAEKLVTSLEILSPSNKRSGSQGRVLYLEKQAEMLAGNVNLVEIDLLRAGRHTTAVPLSRLRKHAGDFDYHVSVHQDERAEEFFVYPVQLREPLPEIEVPLCPGEPGVAMDLQKIFAHAYDTGPYRRRLDYATDRPVPPLRPEQAEWATQILRRKGISPLKSP